MAQRRPVRLALYARRPFAVTGTHDELLDFSPGHRRLVETQVDAAAALLRDVP